MISKRGTERLAGTLLVVGFLLFLGHILTVLTLGPGLATIVFLLLYGFPASLAGLALYRTFRAHDATLALFAAFGFASHGLFVVLTAALLLAGLSFPQGFVTFGAESNHVAGVGSALELSMDKVRTSAFVFMGLGVLPLGILISWSRAVARWIGWLGIVAGVVGFLGTLAGVAGIPAGIVAPIGVLACFAFVLILGVRLLLHEVRPGIAAL